jgi:Ca2+/Na+ antiporter
MLTNLFAVAATAETAETTDSTGTMLTVGAVVGVACIVLGIILLVSKQEFLQNNAFFNGGKYRKGGALIVYRFSGLQMLAMGIFLLLFVAGMVWKIGWLSLVSLVLVLILPLVCSVYMRHSKRFK